MDNELFLESEKKELLRKVTMYLGDRIRDLTTKRIGKWTHREIAKRYGIAQNRQSEWKDYEKYERCLSFQDLILVIGGGFVAVEELISNCAQNEKEEKYLGALRIYEDEELREAATRAVKRGLKPGKILSDALKKIPE